jgi:hypothetical protein
MSDLDPLNIAEIASKYVNQTDKPVFLTGKAGTGKTTFLRNIIKHTHKNAIIVAPTGVAAINAGGVTIHSQFGIPFGCFVPDSSFKPDNYLAKFNTPFTLVKHLNMREHKRKLLQELELLIIDEVSMLRADLLDTIDFVLKSIRRQQHKPFGGVQVLFIGDLLQLPPVVKEEEWGILQNYYKSIYFFDAQVLSNFKPIYIELNKIYRQSDNKFIDLLNNLRNNKVSESDINFLNTFYKPNLDISKETNTITLTTHNYKADELNKTSLQQLQGKSSFYYAKVEDEFNESAYPLEFNLELKLGAQVMFVKNDISGQQLFFNGKIGYISSFSEDGFEIDFKDGSKPIWPERYEWKNIKFELNSVTGEIDEIEIGSFNHFPIKLAWAITIHKSQGLTFDKAILDINKAFAPGQVYVALSRLKSLNGLILTSPINFNSISPDKKLIQYIETKPSDDSLQQQINIETKFYLKSYLLKTYDFTWLNNQLKSHTESYTMVENKSTKQIHKDWAVNIYTTFEPLYINANKFSQQLFNLFETSEENYLNTIIERHRAAKNYFYPVLFSLSKNILSHIELLKDEKQIKSYLEELLLLEGLIFKQIQMLDKTTVVLDTILSGDFFIKDQIKKQTSQLERLEIVKNSIALTQKLEFEERKNQKQLKSKKEKKVKSNSKKEKTPKEDTKTLSYKLYKDGISPEEISKLRKLSLSTIENHLSYYVSLGLIALHDFVTTEKEEIITSAIHQAQSESLAKIKEILGESVSFSEIKFVISYLKNSAK